MLPLQEPTHHVDTASVETHSDGVLEPYEPEAMVETDGEIRSILPFELKLTSMARIPALDKFGRNANQLFDGLELLDLTLEIVIGSHWMLPRVCICCDNCTGHTFAGAPKFVKYLVQ